MFGSIDNIDYCTSSSNFGVMTRRLTISLAHCQQDLIREIRGHAGLNQAELAACGTGEHSISKASIGRAESGIAVSFRVVRDLRAACKEALRRTRDLPAGDRARLNHALDLLAHPTTPPNFRAVRPEVDPPWQMPLQRITSRRDLELFEARLPSFGDADHLHLQSRIWIHLHDPDQYSYISGPDLVEYGFRATPSAFPASSMKALQVFLRGLQKWLSDLVDPLSDDLVDPGQVIRLGKLLSTLSRAGLFISLGLARTATPEPDRLPRDPVFDGDSWLIVLAVAASLVDSLTISARDPISEVIQLR